MSIFSASSPQEFIINLCIKLLIIVAILPIHEYAHAVAAKRMGDNTAENLGRLTLNPLAHIDPIGALFLILFGFGWAKPVPINARNFENYKKGIALTSLAGPLSNLICAAIGIFAYRMCLNVYFMTQTEVLEYVCIALQIFSSINLSLCVFNMIPVHPLDGAKIFSGILPSKVNAYLYKYQRQIYLVFIVLVFAGAISGPMGWIINKIFNLFWKLFFWVDYLVAWIF